MSFWSRNPEDILKELASSQEGLNDIEVEKRLKKYGYNDIPQKKKRTVLDLLFSQLKDLLVIALIVASAISFFTGGEIEGITILIIVIINVTVGFFRNASLSKPFRNLPY